MRDRAFTRKMDFIKAVRKRNISVHNYGWEYYDNLHQYSKNKIHCSCDMCRRRPLWGAGKNSIANDSIADQRRQVAMDEQLKEL